MLVAVLQKTAFEGEQLQTVVGGKLPGAQVIFGADSNDGRLIAPQLFRLDFFDALLQRLHHGVSAGVGVVAFYRLPPKALDHTVVVGDDDKNNADDSLATALGVMTNADIAGYGKSIGLDFASKATKADMISDILASDADVNLELLSDEALRVMASAEQLDVPENATREELIDILGE